MRTAPALQLEVRRFGIWQAAIAALTTAAMANIAAWVASVAPYEPAVTWWLAGAASIASVAAAVTLLRPSAFRLSFDAQGWKLGGVLASSIARPGRIFVRVDLGFWMLLSFQPEPAAGPGLRRWLPLQRRGLEADWHALRCAVYSARPEPATPSRLAAVARAPSPE